MKTLYAEGNYINVNGELFPKTCSFSENAVSFIISRADNPQVVHVVLFSELLANGWEDDLAVLWTEATLRAFLISNTAFTAPSGPIYRAVYQLDYDGVSATDVVVLEDNFPVSPLSPTYNIAGWVDLIQQISLIPCVLSTSQMFLTTLGVYWRFFIYQYNGLPVLRTQSSADAITWVDADYTNDADPSYFPRCLVIVEQYA